MQVLDSGHIAKADAPNSFAAESKGISKRLSDFLSVSLTITVNNIPLVKINGEAKTLDIEIKGLDAAGVRLSDLFGEHKKGLIDSLRDSSDLARSLNRDGWTIRVFDAGDRLASLGRGVSPLTGFVWLNPLKLSKLRRLI